MNRWLRNFQLLFRKNSNQMNFVSHSIVCTLDADDNDVDDLKLRTNFYSHFYVISWMFVPKGGFHQKLVYSHNTK